MLQFTHFSHTQLQSTCVTAISCSVPAAIDPNLTILNRKSGYVLNELMYYNCADGYEIRGPVSRQCQESPRNATGRWTGFTPTCEGKYTFCKWVLNEPLYWELLGYISFTGNTFDVLCFDKATKYQQSVSTNVMQIVLSTWSFDL